MNFVKHLLFGFLFGILFIIIAHYLLKVFPISIEQAITLCSIIFVYSLLPDTDHRNSIISFIFVGLGILGLGIGYYLNNNLINISSFILLVLTYIAWLVGHRQFVHSILFGILVSLPLIYFLGYEFAILSFIAFYSHLFADKEYFKLF